MKALMFFLLALAGCGQIQLPEAPVTNDDGDGERAADSNSGGSPPVTTTVTSCPASHLNAQTIAQAASSGTVSVHSSYPLANAIDNSFSTFMTTGMVLVGDTLKLAFKLQQETDIKEIRLYNDYTDTYALADLVIEFSDDSTNGSDGTWVTSHNVSPSAFTNGDAIINSDLTNTDCALWVRLNMTYNGTGGYGGTPSLYLSEIKIYGR
jgi:hypothetical protein